MNLPAIRAIYKFEMARWRRTLWQSVVSPVVSTSLYFVVFGSAIGSRIAEIDGVSYGAFIVPGLIMLMLLTQSVMNASFGIYFPRFAGTIYEVLSAPISYLEIVIGYVGAAATKSIIIGLIILATAFFAPKISRVDTPPPATPSAFGWRKLIRFKAKAGSAAQSNGMELLYFLQNVFEKSPTGNPFDADKNVYVEPAIWTIEWARNHYKYPVTRYN